MYLFIVAVILCSGVLLIIRPGILCGGKDHKVGTLELSAGAVRLTGIIFVIAGGIMLYGVLSGKLVLPLLS